MRIPTTTTIATVPELVARRGDPWADMDAKATWVHFDLPSTWSTGAARCHVRPLVSVETTMSADTRFR